MSKIRDARIKAGLTMKELSEQIDVPYRSLQNWESEERTPPAYVEKMILNELSKRERKTELSNLLDSAMEDAAECQCDKLTEKIKSIKAVLKTM